MINYTLVQVHWLFYFVPKHWNYTISHHSFYPYSSQKCVITSLYIKPESKASGKKQKTKTALCSVTHIESIKTITRWRGGGIQRDWCETYTGAAVPHTENKASCSDRWEWSHHTPTAPHHHFHLTSLWLNNFVRQYEPGSNLINSWGYNHTYVKCERIKILEGSKGRGPTVH